MGMSMNGQHYVTEMPWAPTQVGKWVGQDKNFTIITKDLKKALIITKYKFEL